MPVYRVGCLTLNIQNCTKAVAWAPLNPDPWPLTPAIPPDTLPLWAKLSHFVFVCKSHTQCFDNSILQLLSALSALCIWITWGIYFNYKCYRLRNTFFPLPSPFSLLSLPDALDFIRPNDDQRVPRSVQRSVRMPAEVDQRWGGETDWVWRWEWCWWELDLIFLLVVDRTFQQSAALIQLGNLLCMLKCC